LTSGLGVGAIVSLTFAAAIDDPARFKSLKQVEAYFRPDTNQIPTGRDGHRRPHLVGDAWVRAPAPKPRALRMARRATEAVAGGSRLLGRRHHLANERVGLAVAAAVTRMRPSPCELVVTRVQGRSLLRRFGDGAALVEMVGMSKKLPARECDETAE
jgi:transposase